MNDKKTNPANNKQWKIISQSGTTGIMLGAAAAFAGHELSEGAQAAEQPEQQFSDAFQAARDEQGPGATFQWNGATYSTCTPEEWNELSEEEQDQLAEEAVAEMEQIELEDVPMIDIAQADFTLDAPEILPADPQLAPSDVEILPAEPEAVPATQQPQPIYSEEIAVVETVETAEAAPSEGIMAEAEKTDEPAMPAAEVETLAVAEAAAQPAEPEDLLPEGADMATADDNPDVAPDMPDYINDAHIDFA